jgi:transcriptional regulator with XRE-family HTH domain
MTKRTLNTAAQVAQLLQQTTKRKRADGSIHHQPISIRQIARDLGKSDRTVRRWLYGEAVPRIDAAESLYEAATAQRRANIAVARRAKIKLDLDETFIVPRLERTQRIVQRRIVGYKDRKPQWETKRGKSDTMRVPVAEVRGTRSRSILQTDFVADLVSQFAGVEAYGKDALVLINYVAPDYNEDDGEVDDETGEPILPPLKRYAYGLHKDRKSGRRQGGWISIAGMSEKQVRELIEGASNYAREAGGTMTTVYIRDPRLRAAAPKSTVRVVKRARKKR